MTEPETEPDVYDESVDADPETVRLSREEYLAHFEARRGRNIALALGLAAFMIIVFVVTIVRLGGNVPHP